MRRTLIRSTLAVLGLAAALTGCSAGPLMEQLPQSLGGLPADTPPAPRTPYQYPAVHDMPPPRATEPLTEEQQWKLERKLKAMRDRQEGPQVNDANPEPGAGKSVKPAKNKAKKKPAAAQASESAGAKPNP